MPVYTVHHTTAYRYGRPVAFGEHRMMLQPSESHDQRLLAFELAIEPRPASLRWAGDGLGNRIGLASFDRRAAALSFLSVARVAHSAAHPDGLHLAPHARTLPVALATDERADLATFLQRAAPDGAVDAWARAFLTAKRATPTLECLTAMVQAIRQRFIYVRRTEGAARAPASTLASRSGACRDFTALMMDAARALGLPARFVSGYLYVPSRDQRDVRGGGATHAWLQVYLPGPGWVDFDPTNGTIGNAGLIRVAVTREPQGATPLSGSFAGFRSDELGMQVTVKVTREDTSGKETAARLRA